jgi:hypothetical protein
MIEYLEVNGLYNWDILCSLEVKGEVDEKVHDLYLTVEHDKL